MTARPSLDNFVRMARDAGYQVISAEQLRMNRWLLMLHDAAGALTLALIQARPLVSAADVQDLGELVRLRRPARGFLVAYGGVFSPTAQRTLVELGDDRLRLCATLPPAIQLDDGEIHTAMPALKSIA